MRIVKYENPLYETVPDAAAAQPGRHPGFADDSARSHSNGSPKSTASLHSSAATSAAAADRPLRRVTVERKGASEPPKPAARAVPSKPRKKRAFWQRLSERPAERSLWARLAPFKACSTGSAIHVLDTVNLADATVRSGRVGGASAANDQSFSPDESPACCSPVSPGGSPPNGSPLSASKLAEHFAALKAADAAVASTETIGAANGYRRPASTEDDAIEMLPRARAEPHATRPNQEGRCTSSRKPKSSDGGARIRKRSQHGTADDSLHRSAAHSWTSKAGSTAAMRKPEELMPPQASNGGEAVLPHMLSSRASITELLENWRANHAGHAPPAHEAPFIDPNEYGGHVNRACYRRPARPEDPATITAVLQSKGSSPPQTHHRRRSSGQHRAPRPAEQPAAREAAPQRVAPPRQLTPLKTPPGRLAKQQREGLVEAGPRGHDTFAEAIGIRRTDKRTGLLTPGRKVAWLEESPPPPRRPPASCIPLEDAFDLDDSCAASEASGAPSGGSGSGSDDLLAETISEAKVASFLASLPSITLDSGSVFLTAIEKQAE